MVDAHVELCKRRLRSLGYTVWDSVVLQGPFAAFLIKVEAARGERREKLYYKQPEPERSGEVELVLSLGKELSPWLTHVKKVFPDKPYALLMEDAGIPISSEAAALRMDAKRREEVWLAVSKHLAELHAQTAESVHQWLQQGKIKPYPYSRSWADWSVTQAERLRAEGISWISADAAAWLQERVDQFHKRYSDALIRSPKVLTHGDVHWGNVLVQGNSITLIDWEWSAAASPMRDIAVLMQDEPDEHVARRIAERHAARLLERGFASSLEDLMHDFHLTLMDNTLMMLGWEIELYFRKEKTEEELRTFMSVAFQRIERTWNEYIQKEGKS